MKIKLVLFMCLIIIGRGCLPLQKRDTVELACHLYVESRNVNAFGVDEVRLTDSLNFRVFVGKCDVEHETFTFVCGDSIIRIYRKIEDADGVWKKRDSLFLPLKDLINHKIDSVRPLFEFR
ncbi:MAG TPA: hypothetical protein VMH27_06530 [Puia sp.]|nr:hypothetical protein [Puia sp.]